MSSPPNPAAWRCLGCPGKAQHPSVPPASLGNAALCFGMLTGKPLGLLGSGNITEVPWVTVYVVFKENSSYNFVSFFFPSFVPPPLLFLQRLMANEASVRAPVPG